MRGGAGAYRTGSEPCQTRSFTRAPPAFIESSLIAAFPTRRKQSPGAVGFTPKRRPSGLALALDVLWHLLDLRSCGVT
jgi:hypothetical protein